MSNRLRTFSVRISLGFAFAVSFCVVCAAQGTGAIRGKVTDQNGMAVMAAKVNVLPLNTRAEGSGVRYVETNAEGRFVMDRLAWGKYLVFAMKEDAGYPDMEPSFYSADIRIPVATITPAAPITSVSIRLGTKAGILEGSVSDAITGAPVPAIFRLVRTANTKDWLSTSRPSAYRVLIPSLTGVSVSVTAPGYKRWTLPKPIKLRPGAGLHLDIRLVPAYNPNLPPVRFLIPEGYVGWMVLVFNQKKAPPAPTEGGAIIFKFPGSGVLKASSRGPEPGARKTYVYYSSDGSVRDVPMDYREGRGMIWGEYDGFIHGARSEFGFFVGTHEQYLQAESQRRVIR